MNKNIYQRNLLIPFLKILIDAIAIESAFLFSFYLRFYSPLTKIIPVTKGYPPFQQYLLASFVLLIIYLVLFSVFHSYRSRYFSTFSQDIPVILKTCILGILFAMSGAFLYRGFSYSRLTFLLVFINTLVFLLSGRAIFHSIRKQYMRQGYGIQRLILIGNSSLISRFCQQIKRKNDHLFQFVGYCAEKKLSELSLPYLGNLQQLSQMLEEIHFEGLLLCFEADEHYKVLEVLEMTEGKNVELFYIPDLLDIITSHTSTLEISGLPVLRLKTVVFSGWQGFLKRTFDIIISLISLIILFPFILLIAIAIKLTSPGPIFYKQKRVGLDGKEFIMLKFRSMKVDAEKETGPVWAKRDDPRVTPIGRILRRTSLDELPQLINVLKGEMSLVGPRPERKVFVEQFQKSIPKYAERHRVRCGMTGWAQVNGLRGQSPIEERTRYDVYYIENWSLWFDIKIIIMTFIAIIKGENAY